MKPKYIIPLVFLFAYHIIRYVFTGLLYSISYLDIFFDVCFVGLIYLYFKKKPYFNFQFNYFKKEILGHFLMGSLLFAIAKYFQMIMPMSLQESGMFILFVLVAPITEELLFRYSFSVLLKEFPLKPIYRMLIISLLFSWMHFFIYFYVSPLMKSFVLYQSIYAFFMGFWWHYRFEKSNNLVEVIILHMVFSLGFWLTSFA